MKGNEALTAARLRELLNYDPQSGRFTKRRGNAQRSGDKRPQGSYCGTTDRKGYVVIKVDGGSYKAHRLAWLHVTGEWPANQIDHRNQVKTDNRWANLREATTAQNKQNQARAYRGNRSGLLGAHFHKRSRKFASSIRVDGKLKHLGEFDTAEEAHQAYLRAKAELHPFGGRSFTGYVQGATP